MNPEFQPTETPKPIETPISRPVTVKKNKKMILVIVIIVLLVIAGIAAYWWRDKTANDAANKQAANIAALNTELASSKTGSTTSVSTGTLSIPEWGIKGSYIGNTPFTYTITGNIAYFSLSSSDTNTNCDNLAFITRLTADQSYSSPSDLSTSVTADSYYLVNWGEAPVKKIGNYYYFFSSLALTDCPVGSVANGTTPSDSEAAAALAKYIATRADAFQILNEVKQFTINAAAI